jgi:tRNA A37 methylthiotransferase MiaB
MAGQVAAEVKAERLARLRLVAQELTQADAQRRVGTTERVLVESSSRGRSESYYPVRLDNDAVMGRENRPLVLKHPPAPECATRGNLVTMRIAGYEQGMLTAVAYGECEEARWNRHR